jgi:hypothetical protein
MAQVVLQYDNIRSRKLSAQRKMHVRFGTRGKGADQRDAIDLFVRELCDPQAFVDCRLRDLSGTRAAHELRLLYGRDDDSVFQERARRVAQ